MIIETAAELPNGQELERREYQRHLAKLRVQMLSSETMPLNVQTVELSMGGMHIECDRHQAQLMSPPPRAEGGAEPRPFTARIAITGASKPKTMTVSADVIDVVPLRDDLYRIGLRFTRYYGKSRYLLEDFLRTQD